FKFRDAVESAHFIIGVCDTHTSATASIYSFENYGISSLLGEFGSFVLIFDRLIGAWDKWNACFMHSFACIKFVSDFRDCFSCWAYKDKVRFFAGPDKRRIF